MIKHPDGSSTEHKWRRKPGSKGETSRIRKEKNANGETEEVWHEVFDKNGKLIHRDWKGPGPRPPGKKEVK